MLPKSLLTLTLFLIGCCTTGMTQSFHKKQMEWIIQLQPGIHPENFLREVTNFVKTGFQSRQLSKRLNIYSVNHLPESILKNPKAHPKILALQRNSAVEFRNVPNDENVDLQWSLETIGLEQAWEITTGGFTDNGDTIVVAILDEGFDVEHIDLSNNVWVNRAEIPNDGIDNDRNGYIDDIRGWNFVIEKPVHTVSQHGQSVAGIVGAVGNNEVGVSGINWNIKLMLFTIGAVDDVIAAYDYIIDQRKRFNTSRGEEGAFVVATNASFGSNGQFCEEQPLWGGMYDQLGNVGVLTGAGTANENWNVDFVGDMPTTCDSDFILTTLNTNEEDIKDNGSAFGNISIDLGSPGENSYTTKPFNLYGFFGSNSAAAPHLTGVIALLYGAPCRELSRDAITNPRETALYIRKKILEGVDKVEALKTQTVTGGRLNAFKSLSSIVNDCTTTFGDLAIQNLTPNPVQDRILVQYESNSFEKHQLSIVNVLGQIVYQTTFSPPRFGFKTLNLEPALPSPGTYILIIQNDNELVSTKFIKW